jgi:hypothetical protein
MLLRRRIKDAVEFPKVYQKCLAYRATSQPSLGRMEPEV